MKKYTYIFGHRNPDTDSICASLAYENLKKNIGEVHVKAARLGEINKETQFALDYFYAKPPALIKSLKPQVADLNLTNTVVIHENDCVNKALELIVYQIGRSLPVVDNENRLIGIVSISDIAPIYLGKKGGLLLKENQTPYKNIVDVISGKVINGNDLERHVSGNLYLVSELAHHEVHKEDIVIMDVEELSTLHSIKEAGCIILCHKKELPLNDFEDYDGLIITTQLSLFEVIQVIHQSIPVSAVANKKNLEYFVANEYLNDVKEDMLSSKRRRFPVVDENGVILGMISRSNFIDINRKKAILVDHNEVNQSIKGIEEADIVEIIDHHRVANIQTASPLYFRTEPIGCTCTIIAKMYEENHIEITQQMAGLMLSAIISDTLLFKSPTCTEQDRKIGTQLADIAGVDLMTYGMDMITAGTLLEDETPESMLTRDLKHFTLGEYKVLISQINTGDFDGFYKIYDEVLKAMYKMCEDNEADLFVLMVTNILVDGSEIIPIGRARWIAENAFNLSKSDGSIFLHNVFSRKKQIVPKLMNYAGL